jgi:hypothetical protein
VRELFHALRHLPENAVARKEWRALGHQARDWRLWVGLRLPKDARGWGVPAVIWFVLAPYVIAGALRVGYHFSPQTFTPVPGFEVDILALCFVLLGVYVCLMAIALMAPTISRERERETWEALRTTVASGHEILIGFIAGRLFPVLAAFMVAGLVWVLTRSHYAPMLQPFAAVRLDHPQIALLVWETLGVSLTLGLVALAASVQFRKTGTAIVVSAFAMFLLAGALVALVIVTRLPGPLLVLLLCLTVSLSAYVVALRGLPTR